ncbi:MAG: hypothetical protein Q8N99_04745 [Nanoarchaeota archaeon]|nr:hypothetical protein [Nanoarchaeota archaeon]
MNILFVCKHNVFRSRIAESYFKKINKNPKFKAKSAGLIKGSINNKAQLNAFKELKIKPASKPKNISIKLLKKQDLIIIVADDLPSVVFDNKSYVKKLVKWNIPDVLYNDREKAKKSILLIKNKVNELLKDLENGNY